MFILSGVALILKYNIDHRDNLDSPETKGSDRIDYPRARLDPDARSRPGRQLILKNKSLALNFLEQAKTQIPDQDFQDYLIEVLTSNQFNRPKNDHPALLKLTLSEKIEVCNRLANESSYGAIMAILIARTTSDDLENFYRDGVKNMSMSTLRSNLIGQITSKVIRNSLHDLIDSRLLHEMYDQGERTERGTMHVRVTSAAQSQIHSNKISFEEFEDIIQMSFFSESEKSIIVSQIRERFTLDP